MTLTCECAGFCCDLFSQAEDFPPAMQAALREVCGPPRGMLPAARYAPRREVCGLREDCPLREEYALREVCGGLGEECARREECAPPRGVYCGAASGLTPANVSSRARWQRTYWPSAICSHAGGVVLHTSMAY